MQTPPRLLLKGWSERIKLYLEIAKLSSSEVVLESRYVPDKQIMSNLWKARTLCWVGKDTMLGPNNCSFYLYNTPGKSLIHRRKEVGEKGINPANICWSSRRLEDVFKTCLTFCDNKNNYFFKKLTSKHRAKRKMFL